MTKMWISSIFLSGQLDTIPPRTSVSEISKLCWELTTHVRDIGVHRIPGRRQGRESDIQLCSLGNSEWFNRRCKLLNMHFFACLA